MTDTNLVNLENFLNSLCVALQAVFGILGVVLFTIGVTKPAQRSRKTFMLSALAILAAFAMPGLINFMVWMAQMNGLLPSRS